jgi:hypothetical protein
MFAPKQNGFDWYCAGFEIAHERGDENCFVPARVHAMFDLIG